jgi:hypothetical protein
MTIGINYVRSEVFTAVTMKNAVFWDVAPCRSCVNRRFGGTYCSHLFTLFPRSRIFYPEDGGDTFLRHVGSHKIYTVPHPRRGNSWGINCLFFLWISWNCSSEAFTQGHNVHTRNDRNTFVLHVSEFSKTNFWSAPWNIFFSRSL